MSALPLFPRAIAREYHLLHMISLRRRQVIIAGLGAVVAPAALYAARLCTVRRDAPGGGAREERLVLSGRVLGGDGKPLAGATVAVGEDRVATDADGRFVLVTSTRAERPLYRVTRDGHTAEGVVSDRRRDADGTLRSTFGLTLA